MWRDGESRGVASMMTIKKGTDASLTESGWHPIEARAWVTSNAMKTGAP
jgi:hypothetical protein